MVLEPLTERLFEGKKPPNRAAAAVTARIAGAQMGATLAWLSSKVLGQYEVFLPQERAGRLVLVAPNIVETERSLGVDPGDFRLWVALHEVTHRTQFTAVPWLHDHVRGEVDALLSAAHLDDPVRCSARSRTASSSAGPLVEVLQSPEQRAVLERVTAFMSLLEGHAEHVMDGVGPGVVPTVAHIRERFQARRGQRTGPLDRLLRKVLGLDLKALQYAEGSVFVRECVEAVGMAGFNRVWESPETLPTRQEVREPRPWVRRVHGAAPPDRPAAAPRRRCGSPSAARSPTCPPARRSPRRCPAAPTASRWPPRSPSSGPAAARSSSTTACSRARAGRRPGRRAVRRPRAGRPRSSPCGSTGRGEGPARSARYAALAGVEGTVLLGHTLDDQAETVLLGLARGSGARALAGMAPVRGPAAPPAARPAARARPRGVRAGRPRAVGGPAQRRPRVRPGPGPQRGAARARGGARPGGGGRARPHGGPAARGRRRPRRAGRRRPEQDAADVARLAALPAAVRSRVLKAWAERACGAAVTGGAGGGAARARRGLVRPGAGRAARGRARGASRAGG